jgi:glutathione S-transferase
MKLYSDAARRAPSPRRVRMYIAEKSLQVEVVSLDLHTDNRTPEFRQKNPMGNLPVLELDDGTCISETIAICRFLEALSPEPRLFGESPVEIATIEMWNRRAEFSFYLPIEFAGGFLGEDVARGARQRVDKTMRLFDSELASRRFIAGETLSVADITTKVAIDFGVRFNQIAVPEDLKNFRRWNAEMDLRPSSKA